MIQALYTGMHGMLSQQRNIDTIANNIANINTGGFKKSRVDFRDALYVRMVSPVNNAPEINLQRGTGALTYQTARDFSQGVWQQTGRALDASIEGPGYFTVEEPGGDVLYTRGGNFYLSTEPGGDFLVDMRGRYLLDDRGGRIAIQGAAAGMVVAADGGLTYQLADGTLVTPGVRLGIADFDNRAGLTDVGDGYFIPSANSGPAFLAVAPEVRQGGLEGSNVDFAEESTRLIRAQRAYQMASRCVSVADQMAQICNTIRT